MTLRLRRAECGHWIPEDTPAAGVTTGSGHSELPVYLCGDCLDIARHQQAPKVETKDVKAVETKGQAQKQAPPITPIEPGPQREGWAACFSGKSATDNPYDGRTRQGREWAKGFAEAEEAQSREAGRR